MSNDPGKKRVEHELFLRAFLSTKPPDRVAAQLSLVTRDAHLEPGELLFEAGQTPESLHFVAAGRIGLETPEGVTTTAEAGSVLDMLDASIPRPRMRTAIALERTHVLALDFADYLDILEDNFVFAVDTLRAGAESYCSLAERLGSTLAFERPDDLPSASASAEMDVVERVLVLQHVGLFRGAPAQALVQLAHLAEIKRWKGGDYLFSRGDAVTEARIVTRGVVVMCHREDTPVASFGPHQIVGDLGFLCAQTQAFSARAEAPAVTIDVHIEDLFDVAEDHFDLWRSMLSYVARQRARLSESMPSRVSDPGRMTL
ncbi:MAG TPA: cyclic nucleotide-binding domain-containing protein [Polyangiaceae bacterium]|nr:cyclic nucleotide-binding domain-containing protein [Polyangiaceae bacterium]